MEDVVAVVEGKKVEFPAMEELSGVKEVRQRCWSGWCCSRERSNEDDDEQYLVMNFRDFLNYFF